MGSNSRPGSHQFSDFELHESSGSQMADLRNQDQCSWLLAPDPSQTRRIATSEKNYGSRISAMLSAIDVYETTCTSESAFSTAPFKLQYPVFASCCSLRADLVNNPFSLPHPGSNACPNPHRIGIIPHTHARFRAVVTMVCSASTSCMPLAWPWDSGESEKADEIKLGRLKSRFHWDLCGILVPIGRS